MAGAYNSSALMPLCGNPEWNNFPVALRVQLIDDVVPTHGCASAQSSHITGPLFRCSILPATWQHEGCEVGMPRGIPVRSSQLTCCQYAFDTATKRIGVGRVLLVDDQDGGEGAARPAGRARGGGRRKGGMRGV